MAANLFQIAAQDKSLEYLAIIFGSMNGLIDPPTVAPRATTVLGSMFGTFNTVILTIGALIIVYVTVVGLLNTAHEGQFMGKNWNNLWIPIRAVVGIASLIPLSSGYSFLQIIMMWVIIQGVGAADVLFRNAVIFANQYSVFGPSVTNSSLQADFTPGSSEVMQGVKNLFMGLTCAVTAAQTYDNPNPSFGSEGGYYCHDNQGQGFCRRVVTDGFAPALTSGSYPGTTYEMGPNRACGTLNFCNQREACQNPASMQCITCQNSLRALENMIPSLAATANIYVQLDYQYMAVYNQMRAHVKDPDHNPRPDVPEWIRNYCAKYNQPDCDNFADLPSPYVKNKIPATPSDVVRNLYWEFGLCPLVSTDCGNAIDENNFYAASVRTYMENIKDGVSTFLAPGSSGAVNQLTQTVASIVDPGWILAGSYYQVIARMNGQNVGNATPTFTVTMDQNEAATSDNKNSSMGDYRSNLDAAGVLIDKISGAAASGGDQATASIATPAKTASNDSAGSFKELVDATNPLVALTITGYVMLMVAQILYVVMIIVSVVMGIASMSFFIFGTGVTNPVGTISTLLYFFLVPLIFMFLGVLVSVGATFAIYIPMIPYVIFTLGAIAWLISTIEAMVAGPIVALGILSPSGHHEMLGKAEPAILLLFNIFLRPSLMLFGFFASMLLSSAVIKMINAGFGTVVENLFNFAGTPGGGIAALVVNPLALVFILVAYVSLLSTAFNKCFSIIHILPDRVITWIGGHAGHGGEAEGLQEQKGAMQSAGAEAKQHYAGGAKETMGKAMGHSEGQAQRGKGNTGKGQGNPGPQVK